MFNALNRFISRLDGEPPASARARDSSCGFQVLRNTNAQLPIEPWFDFIVGINGRTIDNSNPHLFAQEVRNCAGGMVILTLWSAKGQRTRTLHLPVPASSPSLGLTLQWTPLAVTSNIWHVLDVPARSPADAAGLLPYSDYILGTPDGTLHGESALSELVDDHIGRPLRLWVYNHEYNVTREVTITPSRDWGGEGALGCVLGYGALHRLPAPLSEPVNAPGETMFDGEAAAAAVQAAPIEPSELLVPAQMVPIQAPPPPAANTTTTVPAGGVAASRRKKERPHHHVGIDLMDDYFREQEQKSRELDNAPSGRGTPLPPPPKGVGPPPRGGPPRAGTPGTPGGLASPPPPVASPTPAEG